MDVLYAVNAIILGYTTEGLKLINAKYHFDKPLSKQFLYYLNDLSPISFQWLSNDNIMTSMKN